MATATALSPAQQARHILERQTCGNARCACTRSLRRGQGLTHCASHADPHPSLNVTVKEDRLLVHCQATCNQADVVASLREKQLWPESEPAARREETQRTIVATYDYRDAQGQLVFQTLRFFPKGFSQRRPDGHGGWVWNLKDVAPVLYRLPELAAADPRQTVWIVEGEKDADRLIAGGLVATSSPMGAGKWRRAYAEALRDRRVVIVPDNDAPGQEHARDIQASLQGVAASVRILTLPGLAEHGDVSEWLDNGRSVEDLRAVASPVPKTWNAADLMERTLPEPRWAIPGLIAEGLTVLAGRPKFGKSWVALQMALAVAYGGRALSQIKVDAGDSLYLGLEDNERRLQARLYMVVGDGASPQRLSVTHEWPRQDAGGIEALEAWLDEHPSARLIVIDTWTMFRSRPPKGSDAYFEDTAAARRLKQLAEQRHVAIIVLHHTRKPFLGGSVSDFLDEVLGSSGLTAVADSILVLQRQRGQRDAVLHLTGRDILEESRALQWDDATCWSLGGSAEEARLNHERQALLKALRDLDVPTTPSDLAAAMGRPVNNVKQLLFQMSRDAQVLNDGRGRYSAPMPADQGYLRSVREQTAKNEITGNPDNRITEINGASAPPTEANGTNGHSHEAGLAGLPELGELSRLSGLPEVSAIPSCRACGETLKAHERHWPWLHDDCKLDTSPPQRGSP